MQTAMRPAACDLSVLALALVAAVMAGACGSDPDPDAGTGVTEPGDAWADATVYRSHEAQYCSTNPDDDPLYVCGDPLVCVNTYSVLVRGAGPDGGTPVPIFLCRVPCSAGGPCPGGETCCEGQGADSQVRWACVPESRCDLLRDR
jgi:hypothetical protein